MLRRPKRHELEVHQCELGMRIQHEGFSLFGSFGVTSIRQRGFGEVRGLSCRLLLVRIRQCPPLKWDAMNGSDSWQIFFEVFRSNLGFLSIAFVVAPASCWIQEDSVRVVCSFDLVISSFLWSRSGQGQSPWTATRVGEAANPGPVVDADSDDTFDQQIGLEEEYLQATAAMMADDAHVPFLPDEVFYDENEQAPGESVRPKLQSSEVVPGCGNPPLPANHPQDPGKSREERVGPGSHGPVAEEPVGSGVGSPGFPPLTPQEHRRRR